MRFSPIQVLTRLIMFRSNPNDIEVVFLWYFFIVNIFVVVFIVIPIYLTLDIISNKVREHHFPNNEIKIYNDYWQNSQEKCLNTSSLMGVATFVQGTVVQGDLGPRGITRWSIGTMRSLLRAIPQFKQPLQWGRIPKCSAFQMTWSDV